MRYITSETIPSFFKARLDFPERFRQSPVQPGHETTSLPPVLAACHRIGTRPQTGSGAPPRRVPGDFSQDTKIKVLTALRHPDCTFVRGQAVNWITTLRYRGNTDALN
jgi:hypothetical protein